MTYPGGKHGSGVYQQIINRIPPHELYIEAFLGGGAILKMKRPAAASIGIDLDPQVIDNFPRSGTPNLTLLEQNAIDWLSLQKFTSTTFLYLDPPYLLSSRRKNARIYAYELYGQDHIDLLRIIKTLPCMVMISGYPNELYDDALSSWTTATFWGQTRGRAPATEKVWMNYPPPIRLHDYRYLGNTFREREMIKRKRLRWLKRFMAMEDLERNALGAAIDDLNSLAFMRPLHFIDDGQHHQEERTQPMKTF